MATYPRKPRSAFIEWCRVHGTVFSSHAEEIGLSLAEAQGFVDAAALGEQRFLEQKAAQEAARVATQRAAEAIARLEKDAGRLVAKIRAFAGMADAPDDVYAAAQIAPPAQPSPQPPPARPTRLGVSLDPSRGTLTLRWKARNPAGTSGTAYIIRRRLPGESEFSFIGVSGEKWFVDETLVAGARSVEYTVQGQRANSTGPVSPIFTVHFGKLPSGAGSVSVTPANAAQWDVNLPAPSGNGRHVPPVPVRY